MKLVKEECIAIFTIMEQATIRGRDAKLVVDIMSKLDKEIVKELTKEKKQEANGVSKANISKAMSIGA